MQEGSVSHSSLFSEPVVAGEAVLELIPQRSPIVMVDAFYGVDDVCSYSSLTIREDNLFFDNGKFREPGIIEHVAQSAAARVGYVCRQENRPIPVGFIGQLKNFKIHALPSAGDKLCTTIKIESEFMGVSLVSATVYVGEQLLADCQMKIFIKED